MSTLMAPWRQGARHAWASLAQGWHELRERASGALTRFHRSENADHKDRADLGEWGETQGAGWGLMAADMRVDDNRIVVRLEMPGMNREDLQIDIDQDRLCVSGEKRVERESGEGSYRLVQCAYGRFERELPLPHPVDAERSRARYRDGVLRIEMPRLEAGHRRRITVHGP
jgi:HSP20 family protein